MLQCISRSISPEGVQRIPGSAASLTKRAYESGDDAYRIFRKMLESGTPPDDWDRLLAEVRAESDRLQKLVAQTTAAKP